MGNWYFFLFWGKKVMTSQRLGVKYEILNVADKF